MRAMFAAVLLAGAAVLISIQHADAKLATYIITGGDLGDRAYYFDGFGASEVFWLPGTGTQLDSPPAGDLGVAYDIFPAFGYLDVVRQQQGAGPDMRYYPDRGLLHYPHPP